MATVSPLNATLDILDVVVASPLRMPIHIVALASGAASILAIILTFFMLHKNAKGKGFYQRKQGDRLVAYLAVCDLLFNLTQMSGHLLNLITLGRPPRQLCVALAFFLQMFFWTQAVVVIICALCAFLLVAKGIRTEFGKYDYRLLVVTHIIPLFLAIVFVALEYLGSSGHLCYVDITNPDSKIVYVVNSAMMITVAVVCAVLYTGVWIQMMRIKKLLKVSLGSDNQHLAERHQTTKILVCFVAAYFIQWWPLIVHGFWYFIATVPEGIVIPIALFCDLGGVFNFFAYTFIRRIQRKRVAGAPSSGSNVSTLVLYVK